MSFGESKSAIELLVERELTREGEGAVDAATARRIGKAIAEAIARNNDEVELVIRQKLQVAGLHV